MIIPKPEPYKVPMRSTRRLLRKRWEKELQAELNEFGLESYFQHCKMMLLIGSTHLVDLAHTMLDMHDTMTAAQDFANFENEEVADADDEGDVEVGRATPKKDLLQ